MVVSLEVCLRARARYSTIYLSGILVELRVMLQDQEAVMVLLQDVHELKDCEGAAHFWSWNLPSSFLRMVE
jgi:hypothetical protein